MCNLASCHSCALVPRDSLRRVAAPAASSSREEIGHIVTLRGDQAARMDVYLAARRAAGLDPSE